MISRPLLLYHGEIQLKSLYTFHLQSGSSGKSCHVMKDQ